MQELSSAKTITHFSNILNCSILHLLENTRKIEIIHVLFSISDICENKKTVFPPESIGHIKFISRTPLKKIALALNGKSDVLDDTDVNQIFSQFSTTLFIKNSSILIKTMVIEDILKQISPQQTWAYLQENENFDIPLFIIEYLIKLPEKSDHPNNALDYIAKKTHRENCFLQSTTLTDTEIINVLNNEVVFLKIQRLVIELFEEKKAPSPLTKLSLLKQKDDFSSLLKTLKEIYSTRYDNLEEKIRLFFSTIVTYLNENPASPVTDALEEVMPRLREALSCFSSPIP